MEYNNEELEFLLKNIPDRNFISIIKEAGGLLGSPTKKLNYQYRNYLINKALRKNIPLKVKKVIINEIKSVANDKSGSRIEDSKTKTFRLLSKSYLEKEGKNFEKYKQDYLQLKKNEEGKQIEKGTADKCNIEKTRLDKVIESQKNKIKFLNEEQQTSSSLIKKLKKENSLLENENQNQQKLINDQKKQMLELRQELSEIKYELRLSRNVKTNDNSTTEKENRQLILKLRNLQESINNLKEENTIIKNDKYRLEDKIIKLTLRKFLLIGMPVGFKYGSIRIPENTNFQIAVNNGLYSINNDKQIISYSSIDNMIKKIRYPIDEYTRIIIFDGEVTRKDIMEINNKVNKKKVKYVHSINGLENILNRDEG